MNPKQNEEQERNKCVENNMNIQFTTEERAEMSQFFLGIAMDRWARACWRMLNGFVFSSGAHVEILARLIHSCALILPCPICRTHMQDYLRHNPFPIDMVEKGPQWLVSFHNAVTVRIGGTVMEFDAVLKEVAARPINAHVRDWWEYTFAVATLYEPHTQQTAMLAYWQSSAELLPHILGDAMGRPDTLFLESADHMLSALVALPGSPYADRLSALAEFAPPQMLGTVFPVTPDERAELYRLFRARLQGMKDARQRATERIARVAVVENTLESDTDDGGRSVWRVLGIVVAVVVLLVLISLIVIRLRRLR